MSSKFLMDKQKILDLFTKMNEMLRIDGKSLEIYVSGGATMCLYLGTREATHDIDAGTVGGDGNTTAVETLNFYALKMSELFNLPKSWLNTGGNMHITEPMKQDAIRAFTLDSLVVNFLNWQAMLVLKIGAFREQPDITDAVAIIRKYEVRDADQIYEWMEKYRKGWMHIGTRYYIELMLKHAWETEETPYIKLRTLLDTYGYRDKTVAYYAEQIVGERLFYQTEDDWFGSAIVAFDEWKKLEKGLSPSNIFNKPKE